jgi:hypothetical protein
MGEAETPGFIPGGSFLWTKKFTKYKKVPPFAKMFHFLHSCNLW